MKKILFLGYVVPPEESNISIAGNKMQWYILKYLSRMEEIEISCVTVTPMAAFPHNRLLRSKYKTEQLFPGVVSHRVAFCNIPIIKQIWQIASMYCKAKELVGKHGVDTVLTFNLFPQVGIPMRILKKKYKVDTVCVLADLPIDDTSNRNILLRWLRERFDKSTWKSMQICERYVALNENAMKQYLPQKPYIIVDGGIEPDEFPLQPNDWDGKEKNLVYTGALVEYSGIMNQIAAMELLEDKSIVLDIYGDGELRSEIERIAAENTRIRYHGKVSNQEAMLAQQSAWLLVNPRPVESDIAKVTFPSKIFEYLMSGRPVMTTRLNGFSSEYDDLLFWVEGDTAFALAEKINGIAELESGELEKRSIAAREYLLKNKTWEKNAEKIHQFIVASLGE